MTDSAHAVPEAHARLQLPPGTATARVFDCARRHLAELGRQEELWDHAITRDEPARGLLETGDFPEDNVSGFRVQMRYDEAKGSADVRVRGAGAYFVDQGVDLALKEFGDGLTACAGAGAAP